MTIGVIIVEYHSGSSIERCLASLQGAEQVAQIIVVDNGGGYVSPGQGDQSTEEGDARIHSDIEILRPRRNLGFAGAINLALVHLATETACILNPDCELDQPDSLALAASAMEAHGAGMAGCWVVNCQGDEQRATRRKLPTPAAAWRSLLGWERLFPGSGVNLADRDKPAQPLIVEAVSGACMLMPTDFLRRLGGLDEGFFLHGEDLDLMYRVRQAGRSIVLVPEAVIIHQGGVSSARRPALVWYHKHRGMARYVGKHLAPDISLLTQGVVMAAIWGRFAVGLPWQLLRAMLPR